VILSGLNNKEGRIDWEVKKKRRIVIHSEISRTLLAGISSFNFSSPSETERGESKYQTKTQQYF